jgi:predicted SnoaL-like aldol condensation-catalyzing enzyme
MLAQTRKKTREIIIIAVVLAAISLLVACQVEVVQPPSEAEQLEANKEIVRRFYDEVFNQGDMAVADEIVSPDFKDGFSGQTGIDALKGTVNLFRTAFPDMEITYKDMVAEGDLVVITITNNMGAYQGGLGEIFGVPDSAIGQEIVLTGIDYARVVDGKMVEGWGVHDDLRWLQQFGLELVPVSE